MKASGSSHLAKHLTDRVRGQGDALITRWADLIKDMMLDWEFSLGDDDETIVDELPPLSEEQFVQALQGKMEQTLRQVARIINQAPTGQIVTASEEQVCRLLTELWATAMQLGVQMRLEAAEVEAPPLAKPQGVWAQKLRRMLAGGTDLPLSETVQPIQASE